MELTESFNNMETIDILKLEVDICSQCSLQKGKPNEDYVYYNAPHKLFAVIDGVTRDKFNNNYPNPSPSAEVAKIIATKSFEYLENFPEDIDHSVVRMAMEAANHAVFLFNKGKKWSFFPGAVGIIATIQSDLFYYAYIGDCVGFRIRENNVSKFTYEQTKLIHKYSKEFTSDQIRNFICNNVEHPYGYGVINGELGAENFIREGAFYVEKNDIIVLHTDGLNHLMATKSVSEIAILSAEDAINEATKVERNTLIKSDDKAIMIIKVL